MTSFREIWFRFRTMCRMQTADDEMAEEFRHHVEMRVERNLASGMSQKEARAAAQRSFGCVEQIKEASRDERGVRWLSEGLRDLRLGLRQLRKSPAFTFVAVLSLALGIGANTAIFSSLDKTLLRPLAAKSPRELVRLQWLSGPKGTTPSMSGGEIFRRDEVTGRMAGSIFSVPTFERMQAENATLADVFAFAPAPALHLEIDAQVEGGFGQVVSGGYYRGLGVRAFRGRTIVPEDDRPGSTPVAVMSYRYWRSRFGGEGSAIGKVITVNKIRVTLVGVTPPEFFDPVTALTDEPQLTFPLAMMSRMDPNGLGGHPELYRSPEFWWIWIMGRLRDEATTDQAASDLGRLFSPPERMVLEKDYPILRVTPGARGFVEDREINAKPLTVLMGLVALVLICACVNVANILLARGVCRQREIAIRLALGASRGRIIRQLLTEGLLVAVLGAAFGLLFAIWGAQLFSVRENLPASIDWRIMAFTTVLTFLTALGFGLAPAIRATRLDIATEFQGGARQLGSTGRSRLSQTLLVLQVAISLVLLVGAGLFLRTLLNLRAVDVGFDKSHLLLFALDATPAGYKHGEATDLFERVRERLQSVPGVRSATFSDTPLLTHFTGNRIGRVAVPGRTLPPEMDANISINPVGPNFFSTAKMKLIRGRTLDEHDDGSPHKIAVINDAMSKTYFGEENPIGRYFTAASTAYEVVGVVGDAKYGNIRTAPWPTAFVPASEMSFPVWQTFTVRTYGDPSAMLPAVRKTVNDLNPQLLIDGLRTEDDELNNNLLREERSVARISGFFGIVALALSCVGLYGLVSYSVFRRTGELGLRMALGARPGMILWMIVRESLVLVLTGVVIGLCMAAGTTRIVSELLFGVSAVDPATYVLTTLLLLSVATMASLLPARRAAKVDPMVAMRYE